MSLARGGPGFGGGVGDGLRVRRLRRIELIECYLVSREVGGLRERFSVTCAHKLRVKQICAKKEMVQMFNIVIKY